MENLAVYESVRVIGTHHWDGDGGDPGAVTPFQRHRCAPLLPSCREIAERTAPALNAKTHRRVNQQPVGNRSGACPNAWSYDAWLPDLDSNQEPSG